VSQLPVLQPAGDGPRLAGVIDESDLLQKVHRNPDLFGSAVRTAMTTRLETIAPGASMSTLEAILDRGLVAIVADERGFHGLITRFDLLNHLRRSQA
jgi:cystathionine beta-synthase